MFFVKRRTTHKTIKEVSKKKSNIKKNHHIVNLRDGFLPLEIDNNKHSSLLRRISDDSLFMLSVILCIPLSASALFYNKSKHIMGMKNNTQHYIKHGVNNVIAKYDKHEY